MDAAPMAGPERAPLISALQADAVLALRGGTQHPGASWITIFTGPMSVSTAFDLVPLREFLPSRPAGSCLS